MKIIVLTIFLVGYGFHVYSQGLQYPKDLQYPIDDLSGAAQSERCIALAYFTNSCLRYAESLEAEGKQYRPKDYFAALHAIDSLADLYNVPPPHNITKTLGIIMRRGETFIPEDIKSELSLEWSKYKHPTASLEEILGDIFKALKILCILIALGYILANIGELIKKLKKLLSYIRIIGQKFNNLIVFKPFWQSSNINLYIPSVKRYFFCFIRGPTVYINSIEHVPLFVSFQNSNSF